MKKGRKVVGRPVPRIELPEPMVDQYKWDELDAKRTIRFRLGPEDWNWIDVRIRRWYDKAKPVLEIMGCQAVAVYPSAGNVVYVEIGK